IQPVSPRFGTRIIDNGGTPVGYLNMRTFINTADPQLRAAFLDFRNRGITQFIIDFRYNGGGLVDIADLMGDLLGRDRSTTDVFGFTTFRPEKAVNNTTDRFSPQPQSVAPTRIAFIGTGATASASELVMNGMIPYLRTNVALVGANTFGKPVGQIGLDLAACDDRLRIVAFATQNADRQGDYYTGMASVMPNTCVASDDLTRPMGDPAETSTARALDFLAGRSCTSITASAREASGGNRVMAEAREPDVAQREVPGLF
ncbi:MAG: S41 family peptidase, partial [Sphingomonadales bacterium]